ncbi:DUF3798 domain-containing protein [Peptacetobacter sp.]|uniref:DUF3798 domain-containing protein n=1 Tax=Peptacetobacter sp. TaxID=2991975 RepID=UPI00261FDEBA|nr:DUF3798 domain-containing protein [Peptacetobacter sp.]
MVKKVVSLILLLSIVSLSLVGCETKEDKSTKIAIVTENKNEDYNNYMSANYIKNIYKQNNKSNIVNDEIIHMIMPNEFVNNTKESEKFIKKIINNKDLNGVVFASDKKGIVDYTKKIKKSRKDMVVIGADLNATEKELAKNLDLSYISNTNLNGKNTVELAKEMGAESFIIYYSEKDLKDKPNFRKKISEIESECKVQDIKLEKIKVKDINTKKDEYEVKKFISENINNQIYKYGKEINLFGTNNIIDDVILKRAIKSKLIVAESSDICMTEDLKDLFRVIRNTVYLGDYKSYSRSISDRSSKYEMRGRLGGITMPNKRFTVYAAVDTAIAIVENDMDIKKAYKPVFLEKNIDEKEGITASFESINKKYPSVKVVTIDQLIY